MALMTHYYLLVRREVYLELADTRPGQTIMHQYRQYQKQKKMLTIVNKLTVPLLYLFVCYIRADPLYYLN